MRVADLAISSRRCSWTWLGSNPFPGTACAQGLLVAAVCCPGHACQDVPWHSFNHSFNNSIIHSFNHHSLTQSFLPSGIHPSFHACMHPFICHSYNCLLYLAAAHQCHYNCFFAADDNHLTSLLFSHSSVALCCCTRVSRNCLIRATFSSQSFKSSNVLTSSTNECATLWPADLRTEQITPSFTVTTYRKSQEVPFCKPSVACTVSVTFNCYRTSQNVPWTSRLLYKF